MIKLYAMGSPNVLKIVVALEEMECPYELVHVGVLQGENFTPEFLELNPLGKVPVLIDDNSSLGGRPLFESGAILIYLAEQYGPQFFPAVGPERWEVMKWLMFQIAYAGPMLGQVNHFQFLPSESGSYASQRYKTQAERVYGAANDRLAKNEWMGGETYSIADMALYPWAAYVARQGFDPEKYSHLIAWRDRMDSRPQVRRASTNLQNLIGNHPSSRELPKDEHLDAFFARSSGMPKLDAAHYFGLGSFFSVNPDA